MGNSGHWIAGMIRWAGGEDTLARDGTDSVRIAWDEVRRCEPEVIVISPCGFGTEQSFIQAQELKHLPGWASLPAVKNGLVFANDHGIRAVSFNVDSFSDLIREIHHVGDLVDTKAAAKRGKKPLTFVTFGQV